MKKPTPESRRRHKSKPGMTLGRERFAQISAVEGIELTADMRSRAADFDRRGIPPTERRRAIVRAYSKS